MWGRSLLSRGCCPVLTRRSARGAVASAILEVAVGLELRKGHLEHLEHEAVTDDALEQRALLHGVDETEAGSEEAIEIAESLEEVLAEHRTRRGREGRVGSGTMRAGTLAVCSRGEITEARVEIAIRVLVLHERLVEGAEVVTRTEVGALAAHRLERRRHEAGQLAHDVRERRKVFAAQTLKVRAGEQTATCDRRHRRAEDRLEQEGHDLVDALGIDDRVDLDVDLNLDAHTVDAADHAGSRLGELAGHRLGDELLQLGLHEVDGGDEVTEQLREQFVDDRLRAGGEARDLRLGLDGQVGEGVGGLAGDDRDHDFLSLTRLDADNL